jgi:hypothetical protein
LLALLGGATIVDVSRLRVNGIVHSHRKTEIFFLTTVYFPPLQRDLADLKARITAAVENIDAPMLTRVART